MDKHTFNKLLKNKHNSKAFSEIYKFYFHRIVFFITRRFNRNIAEDIAQDFFKKLLTLEIKNYIDYPTTWVFTCCENLALTYVTKNNDTQDLTGKEYIEFISSFDNNEELLNALAQLEDATQKIFYLYYWEGFSLKEISMILIVPYDAIKQRHSRSLKKLKKILELCHQN